MQKEFIATLKSIKENPHLIAFIFFIDILFVVIAVFSANMIFTQIAMNTQAMQSLIQGINIEGLQDQDALAQLSQNYAQTIAYQRQITYLVVAFALIMLALWLIFQGLSYYLSYKAAGVKLTLKEFYKNFTTATIIYYIFIVLITSYLVKVFMQILSGESTVKIIIYVLLGIVAYFSLITLSILNRSAKQLFKSTILISFKRMLDNVISYAALAVVFIGIFYLVMYLQSFLAKLLFGVILSFSSILLFRIYFIILNKQAEVRK